ncbi:MAG: hypothetical protein GXP28_11560 [Planctomycetes bacterium]|nr:hypothetical protein [Planctomycetota bacterium]
MIYSAGLKSAVPSVGGSRTLAEFPEENSYAVAEFPDRRSSVFEASPPYTETLDTEPLVAEADAEQLALRILKRIESRLPCRIRKLRVVVAEHAVVLEGQCSTYYTKQIAQHTAMGVLEYERLTNHIEVCSAK